MTRSAPHSREELARAETVEALVELLVAHVDRAYVTAGQSGVLTAVRELFRRMDPAALSALAYQLDLVAEPVSDEPHEGEAQ